MNHTAYRHVSMPCPVMRGSLWLRLEGSGEFELVGQAEDGAVAVVVWAVRNGLISATRSGCGTAEKQLRRKRGNDADHPAYIFIEPSVGYRMENGEMRGREEE